ncbi:AraC family transcriptional regulator [Frankia sp. AiPs1]|uniref:AraC family transcriptional regulator n=1 Tax=Frankia sp. AiPs1 TaxID=573493 RepID=UPI0035AB7164
MDLLADVLAVSGVRGTLGARIEAGQDWAVWWSDCPGAAFYAVTTGTAWLTLPGHEPCQLLPGDVVLLPTASGHTLASHPEATAPACDATAAAADHARRHSDVLRFGTGPVQTHILGAGYDHDPAVTTQVLALSPALSPALVHLRADHGTPLDDTVRLLARELAHPQIASVVVLNRLVDILLVQLLRVWLSTEPAHCQGSWLGALSDPIMSQALTKLHQDPARPWTTADLAAEMAVSRATLTRRFRAVTGQTPGAYLTQWRMDLAALRLRDTDDPLETIAAAVGYTSVYAFNRAFNRARAQPPGRYRITSRQPTPTGARTSSG